MIRVVDRTPFEPSPLAPRRSPDEQARDRDLGFGSVVSRESRQRLLNRDGSFNVVRSGLSFLEGFAPYHLLLSISWTGFFGVIASYVVINLMFAVRLPSVRVRRPGRAGDRVSVDISRVHEIEELTES